MPHKSAAHKSAHKKSASKKSHNSHKKSTPKKHPHMHHGKPKTRTILSHKSRPRAHASHATSNMSITDLQFMAKSKGIPFGGLTKTQLIDKINRF
jgi:hypothetical protein